MPSSNPSRSNLKGISIQLKMTGIILKLWYWNFIFDSITIGYFDEDGKNFVHVDSNNLEISEKSENYWSIFKQYLSSVLEDFDGILEYFHIDFGILEFQSGHPKIQKIRKIFKSRAKPLNVQYLHLQYPGEFQLEKLLPCFQWKHLERANFEFPENNDGKIAFRELFDTDLWRMGKNSIWNFRIQSLTSGNLQAVKKTFSSPTTPRNVRIKYEFIDITALDELFGTLFKNDNGEFIRIINIPGTKGSILETRVHGDTEELQSLSSMDISKSNILRVFENSLIMDNLLKCLGCFEIQRLRKLSRCIRSCVDTLKPDALIQKLAITVDDIDAIRLDIFMKNRQSTTVCYAKNREGDGCFVNRHLLQTTDYKLQFATDLELILRFQKSRMEELSLSFPYYSYLKEVQSAGYEVDYEMLEEITGDFLKKLKELLSTRAQPLQVEKLKIEAFSQQQLLEILPFLDPKPVKTIEIGYPHRVDPGSRYLEIQEISKLEQWIRADELIIWDRTIVSTRISEMNLFGFSKVSITVDTISSDDLVYIREELLKHTGFEKFKVSFKNIDNAFRLMGAPYSKTRNIITWYFRYPSQDQALCLMFSVPRAVVFTRIHMTAVPENAFSDVI
ncbi:hypothetical protein CAEBREN_11499 [Caenorhabditis brenneri]|uniref:DUF38 domain-containing protein n=1 Tax=Caenorhabditis brenneri TaxID=135651 RepID=G0PIS9_CAEBE|nr:hypothetical protein CAEBREN_11499 [Caenorhabditis brenneri]